MILSALAAAALALSAPAGAGARDWDEFDYSVGGGGFLFGMLIENALFADGEVVAQFRRIGVDSACSIFNRHYPAAVASHQSQFRPVLIGAVRSQVPADILRADRPLAWEMAPIQARKLRIIDEVERSGASVLAAARGELRAAFLTEARQAAVAEGAASAFSDWDLESPLARRRACMLLRAGPPEHFAARKAPFDGFFRRGDAH